MRKKYKNKFINNNVLYSNKMCPSFSCRFTVCSKIWLYNVSEVINGSRVNPILALVFHFILVCWPKTNLVFRV